MKICKRCGRDLPLDEFYKHPMMGDGHLNYCKSCVKQRVNAYRQKNIDRIREYDKKRGKNRERSDKATLVTRRRRLEVPNYRLAHNLVRKAIKSGNITKSPFCLVCGKVTKTEGHHEDYSKPLRVLWLCPACHKTYHLGKGDRAMAVRNKVASLLAEF